MELYQAQAFIKDGAEDIRKMGAAAAPPNIGEFMMAMFIVLDDMMETVKRLDDWYNNEHDVRTPW